MSICQWQIESESGFLNAQVDVETFVGRLIIIIVMYPEFVRFAVIFYDIPVSVRKALDNGSQWVLEKC